MNTPHPPSPGRLPRRAFLAKTAAATATTLTVLESAAVFGAEANAVLELGLIGCGGRGRWIAELFAQTGLYRWVACADYFQDRVDAVGEKYGIAADRRYTGLAGYRRLLEGKLDAVVIETPPYFHPEESWAAVEAGKHVFVAKPIAVDVPGCETIAEAGRQATAKKLVFLVDFQTRAHELYREALRRVRRGDLGKLVLGEAHYPWAGGGRGTPPATAEGRLRSWYYVVELSGDFIVEQAIHALDVATWILDADPVRAVGMGGRKLRPAGSIWDHFAVNYWFANDVPLSFTCIQTIPEMRDEITARIYGSEGYIYTDYFGQVWIRGNEPFPGGSVGNLYTTGAQTNIREFHQFITTGRYDNPTVAPSVRSNLTAILGREAAYRGGEVTWAGLLKEAKRLEPDLREAKS
ncbi:MAG: Gfo/Idh/MocA family oxidoreductase [Verrucomicrobia bacterium]|nr:Gfo/Idh/MocA family oxidoreductase [Verrucomicrobiota bacterium]